MPSLGAPEIIVVAIVVLILFGAKRMPDAARSLGRSLRIFKAETRGLRHDEDDARDQPRPADVTVNGRPLGADREPLDPR